jgi:hypothetical protein
VEPMSYGIQIRCVGGDFEFYVDQRLPMFPERETLVALKDEAEGTFEVLFEARVEEMFVSLSLAPGEQDETATEEVEVDGD